jgi:hypothetical protein
MPTANAPYCSDEACALLLDKYGDEPAVCVHYASTIDALAYWGRVARDELSADDVIEPYLDAYDFSDATSLSDHCDDEGQYVGPTATLEVRVDGAPVKAFTAYPHDGAYHPGVDTCKQRAIGYAEALVDGFHAGEIRAGWDTAPAWD